MHLNLKELVSAKETMRVKGICIIIINDKEVPVLQKLHYKVY